jgi:hypothetical protein
MALVADLHGRADHLDAVRAHASRRGLGPPLVCGDYLECLVPKRAVASARPTRLDEVVVVDRPLWLELARCRLIRGNQEERIALLTRHLPADPELSPLLGAEERLPVAGDVVAVHGHGLDWTRVDTVDGPRWAPTLDDALPGERVVVFGHSHRPLLTTVDDDTSAYLEHRDLVEDVPFSVAPPGRKLVNLPPANRRPRWVDYDEQAQTMTLRVAR